MSLPIAFESNASDRYQQSGDFKDKDISSDDLFVLDVSSILCSRNKVLILFTQRFIYVQHPINRFFDSSDLTTI